MSRRVWAVGGRGRRGGAGVSFVIGRIPKRVMELNARGTGGNED